MYIYIYIGLSLGSCPLAALASGFSLSATLALALAGRSPSSGRRNGTAEGYLDHEHWRPLMPVDSGPNQHCITGYSWTTPSVVSPAGFSTVVPPRSGHPHDVGWPVWGAGLLMVHSHDGPTGIYGSRIFEPWPKNSGEKRPVLVENYDSHEQIILTCLLSAAGQWSDILPDFTMQEYGNWWLLRMLGGDRLAEFGYDRKATRGTETLRAVAAVNFAFHWVFGTIRCTGECKAIRSLGDFLWGASCDEWDFCYEWIDPRAPFHSVVRPNAERPLVLVYGKPYPLAVGETKMQIPCTRCRTHPMCGRCRHALRMEDLSQIERRRILDRFWPDAS